MKQTGKYIILFCKNWLMALFFGFCSYQEKRNDKERCAEYCDYCPCRSWENNFGGCNVEASKGRIIHFTLYILVICFKSDHKLGPFSPLHMLFFLLSSMLFGAMKLECLYLGNSDTSSSSA